MAAESDVEYLSQDVLPDGLEVIPLPGHFLGMVGFRTKDDVVYLADSLSSRESLEKYGITFIYDVGQYLKTLEMIKRMNARLFIPSHAAVTDDIVPLAEYNIYKVNEVADKIAEACVTPLSSDEVIRRMFLSYGLTMNMQQYVLVGSTIRSYLSWLRDNGKIDIIADDGIIRFKRI